VFLCYLGATTTIDRFLIEFKAVDKCGHLTNCVMLSS